VGVRWRIPVVAVALGLALTACSTSDSGARGGENGSVGLLARGSSQCTDSTGFVAGTASTASASLAGGGLVVPLTSVGLSSDGRSLFFDMTLASAPIEFPYTIDSYIVHLYSSRDIGPNTVPISFGIGYHGQGSGKTTGWTTIISDVRLPGHGSSPNITPTIDGNFISETIPDDLLPGLSTPFYWTAEAWVFQEAVPSNLGPVSHLASAYDYCPIPSGGYSQSNPIWLGSDLIRLPAAPTSARTSVPMTTTTTASAPSSSQPQVSSGIPPGLVKAVLASVGNAYPAGELILTAKSDPANTDWIQVDIEGRGSFANTVQGAADIADLSNGTWRVVLGPGSDFTCPRPSSVPLQVWNYFVNPC
jgi:hypothetical protein